MKTDTRGCQHRSCAKELTESSTDQRQRRSGIGTLARTPGATAIVSWRILMGWVFTRILLRVVR